MSYGGRTTSHGGFDDYQDWFLQFLRHRSQSDRIVENTDELVISTDIANFFPTINLDLLRDKVVSGTSSHPHCINLLFRLLREFGGSSPYDPFALRGLPQEPDDNCRLLASFYLRDLDAALYELGLKDRYSRFVDDIVLSSVTQLEASRRVAQVQGVLERLGLSANSSKTRVQTKSGFRDEHYPEENAFFDQFAGPLFIPFVAPNFDEQAKRLSQAPPVGSWIQVMKRCYGIARQLQSRILIPSAWKNLPLFPELAPAILDYLQVVQPTISMATRLTEFIKDEASVFEDVQILSYEMLLHAPFDNNRKLRRHLVTSAYNHLDGSDGFQKANSYISSLCMLTIFKFGEPSDVEALAPQIEKSDLSVEEARQLYVLLRSSKQGLERAEILPPRFDDPDLWRFASLFNAIDSEPIEVLEKGRKWFGSKVTTLPRRHIFRVRTLPVLTSLYANEEVREPTAKVVQEVMRHLRSAENPKLIDRVALAKLKPISYSQHR